MSGCFWWEVYVFIDLVVDVGYIIYDRLSFRVLVEDYFILIGLWFVWC